jgi:hypothetical protein
MPSIRQSAWASLTQKASVVLRGGFRPQAQRDEASWPRSLVSEDAKTDIRLDRGERSSAAEIQIACIEYVAAPLAA